jgi:hypothetical protein
MSAWTSPACAENGFSFTTPSAWAKAGGRGEILDLPSRLRHVLVSHSQVPANGIPGNSHMPMMDRNSDEVLDAVVGWLDERRAEGAFN